jgi:hypothetical protein
VYRGHHSLLHNTRQHSVIECHPRRAAILAAAGATSDRTVTLWRSAARDRLGIAPHQQPSASSPHPTTATATATTTTTPSAAVPVGGSKETAQRQQQQAASSSSAACAPPASPFAPAVAVPGTRRKLLGFHIVSDVATLTFPHDEAPMRVYILCELWAKAVKQVRLACTCNFVCRQASYVMPYDSCTCGRDALFTKKTVTA